MKKKFLLLAALAGLVVCAITACKSKEEFVAGETLSSDAAADLRDTLREQGAPKTESTGEQKTYYFVEGSSEVYHTEQDCAHLSQSTDVKSGNMADVELAGKTRLCSTCAPDEQQEEDTETSETLEDEQEVCYYTENGSVWHYDRWCSALLKSHTVSSGTVAEAIAQGKSRPCAHCGE